jgi:DtxR family Mn-dependent transcriptional regulator
MNQETREEYLETLYKLSKGPYNIKTGQIAEFLEVSPSTVTEVLPTLEDEGYIEYLPYYGVKLTEKGLEEGKRIVRTHRILEVFLVRYFSMNNQELHEKACKMEHIFDEEMINIICEKMGAPDRCPHGNKIPACSKNECPIDNHDYED